MIDQRQLPAGASGRLIEQVASTSHRGHCGGRGHISGNGGTAPHWGDTGGGAGSGGHRHAAGGDVDTTPGGCSGGGGLLLGACRAEQSRGRRREGKGPLSKGHGTQS